MKKAHWLPCQPLIFPVKINRGRRWGFLDNGKMNGSCRLIIVALK